MRYPQAPTRTPAGLFKKFFVFFCIKEIAHWKLNVTNFVLVLRSRSPSSVYPLHEPSLISFVALMLARWLLVLIAITASADGCCCYCKQFSSSFTAGEVNSQHHARPGRGAAFFFVWEKRI